MTVFLHVGFAKCASTSIQQAFCSSPRLTYPKAGRWGMEHLALPLSLFGLDEWTKQFVTEQWVESEIQLMKAECAASRRPTVISSERLISMREREFSRLDDFLAGRKVEIIVCTRPIQKLARSMWQHSVMELDLVEPFEEYQTRFAHFSYEAVIHPLEEFHHVHHIDIESDDIASRIREITGESVSVPRANESIPFQAAELLQLFHIKMGTMNFKRIFNYERKKEFVRELDASTLGQTIETTAKIN